MVTYKLLTGFGTLKLPFEQCYYCFNDMHFTRCTSCPVTTEFKESAKIVVNRFDELLNKEEEE